MKRLLAVLASIILTTTGVSEASTVYLNDKSLDHLKLDYSRIEDMSKDYLSFSNILLRIVQIDTTENNFVISPQSAYLPLAELEHATDKGDIKTDLNKLLKPSMPNEYTTGYIKSIAKMHGVESYSSIWLDKTTSADISYLKRMNSDIFRGDLKDIAYAKEQIRWINTKTKGMLKDNLNPEKFVMKAVGQEDPAVRLIGTAYFKSSWSQDDMIEDKDALIFQNKDGSNSTVDRLMTNVNTAYIKDNANKVEMIQIPLKQSHLYIVMPEKGQDIKNLIENDILKKVMAYPKLEYVEAKIELPKFSVNTSIELLPLLSKLGFKNIEKPSIAFPKLLGNGVSGRISSILQESKIDVKKEGIEAASYTKVDMVKMSSMVTPDLKKINFKVDRPFIFFIMGKDKMPTFIGVVNELKGDK